MPHLMRPAETRFMVISLRKATYEECDLLHSIQVKSFIGLLQKYNDFDSNPAAESLDRIQQRYQQPLYFRIRTQWCFSGCCLTGSSAISTRSSAVNSWIFASYQDIFWL